MSRPSLREQIIESGVTTVHTRGFAATGIREIASAAKVPQGSFTNHFRSKEAFGLAVLDRYFDRTVAILEATLADETRAPVERLRAYFDAVASKLEEVGWRHGCMISNLSTESPEHSEMIRARLEQILETLVGRFAEVVRLAQQAGELRSDLAPEEAADVLLAAWRGAMMRMQVDRSEAPIERFKRVFLGTLLAPSPNAIPTATSNTSPAPRRRASRRGDPGGGH